MKKILSFITLSLIVFVILQVGLTGYLRWRVSEGDWIESVASKGLLLEQRPMTQVILLGTSTTQNHFNTLSMSEQGIQYFNYGLPGRYWEDFPSILRSFKSSKATHVILSLPARVFIHPVSCPSFRTLHDLWFFYQLKGTECIHQFNLRHFFPLYSDWPFMGYVFRPSESYFEKTQLKYGVDLKADARKINYARGNEARSVVTFKNGDGAVFSDSVERANLVPSQTKILDKSAQDLHPEALEFMRQLAAEVHAQGKRLSVILEPRKANETILINTAQLSATLGPQVTLILNHAWSIPPQNWADFMHLKPVAAQAYTELVTCQLQHPSCESALEKLTTVLP